MQREDLNSSEPIRPDGPVPPHMPSEEPVPTGEPAQPEESALRPKLVYSGNDAASQKPKEGEFDAANYFKEVSALRRKSSPVIKKVTTFEVKVGRLLPTTWFQVNPDEAMTLECVCLRDKDKNYYYVDDDLKDEPILQSWLKPVLLVEAAAWPPDIPYLVPFHIPDPDRDIPAYTSAWSVYEQARSGIWTQMIWGKGEFLRLSAENNKHKPVFSGKPIFELLAHGFKKRIVRSIDHEYVKAVIRGVAD
jgi:hypothetical protein